MIVAVSLPLLSYASRSTYVKVRDRAQYDFALASAAVAVDLDGGTIRDARIALGGVGTKPWRCREAETDFAERCRTARVSPARPRTPWRARNRAAATPTKFGWHSARSSARWKWRPRDQPLIGAPARSRRGTREGRRQRELHDDYRVEGMLHAVVVASTIASGTIAGDRRSGGTGSRRRD